MAVRELIDELEHVAAVRGDKEQVFLMSDVGTPLRIAMIDNDSTGTWLYVRADGSNGDL